MNLPRKSLLVGKAIALPRKPQKAIALLMVQDLKALRLSTPIDIFLFI